MAVDSPSTITSSKLELPVISGTILVTLMMVSVAFGVVQLGRRVAPDWQSGYLVWMSLFLSLEAAYTRRSTRDLEPNQRLVFRLSEWAAFAILIKLLSYTKDPARILSEIPLWQEDFLTFLTGEYMVAMAFALLIWLSSSAYAGEIDQIYDRGQENEWDDLGKLQNALQDVRRRVAARIFLIGGLVVILAVLTRIDATNLLRTVGVVMPGYNAPVVNVLAYFFFGLVLLSQTQYAMLRTRWQWQKMAVEPSIPANWIRYSLVFFAVVVIIVFFLPTEYSLGLFDTLRVVVDMLFGFVSLILMLLLLPFGFCASLFRATSGEPQDTPPMAPPPPPPVAQQEPLDWMVFIRSLFFWMIFLVILFMVFNYYIRQNKTLLLTLRKFPLLRWLGQNLRAFWLWIRGVNNQVGRLVSSGIQRFRAQRITPPTQVLRRVFNFHRLTPRDKIIYYYLNLVKMGGEHGFERKPSQTPYQYEGSLAEALPDIDHELLELTDTFIEARYSNHQVEEPRAQQAGSLWEKVKTVLRNLRKEE